MSKVYIASTMSADVEYQFTAPVKQSAEERKRDLRKPTVKATVTIKGGANLGQLPGIVTPKGVVTSVGEKDYEWLKDNDAFKRHMNRGFLSVHDKEVSGNQAAGSMEKHDGSAPNMVQEGELKHVPQAE